MYAATIPLLAGLAEPLGVAVQRVLVVGCEPAVIVPPDDERLVMELSPPVREAARRAVEVVETIARDAMSSVDVGTRGWMPRGGDPEQEVRS